MKIKILILSFCFAFCGEEKKVKEDVTCNMVLDKFHAVQGHPVGFLSYNSRLYLVRVNNCSDLECLIYFTGYGFSHIRKEALSLGASDTCEMKYKYYAYIERFPWEEN